MHYDSDFGFLNSITKALLISSSIAFGLLMKYFIYHFSALSLSDMTIYAFFTSSLLIYLVVHTVSAMYQNWLGSSDPSPLKIGSLMSSTILILLNRLGGGAGGGGGRSVGEVWGGGWGMRGCYTTFCHYPCTLHSLIPEDLYSETRMLFLHKENPIVSLFMKKIPLDTRASSWSPIQQFVNSLSQVVGVFTLFICFWSFSQLLPLLA